MAVRDPCDEVDRALTKAMEGRGGLPKDRFLIRPIPPPFRLGWTPSKKMMTEAEFKASAPIEETWIDTRIKVRESIVHFVATLVSTTQNPIDIAILARSTSMANEIMRMIRAKVGTSELRKGYRLTVPLGPRKGCVKIYVTSTNSKQNRGINGDLFIYYDPGSFCEIVSTFAPISSARNVAVVMFASKRMVDSEQGQRWADYIFNGAVGTP